MSDNQKRIELEGVKFNMQKINATDMVFNIKPKIAKFLKSDLELNVANVASKLLLELDKNLVMDLFRYVTVEGKGSLSEEQTFNAVFNEIGCEYVQLLIIDFLDFNNFFTKKLFTELGERFPILKEKMEEMMGNLKTQVIPTIE